MNSGIRLFMTLFLAVSICSPQTPLDVLQLLAWGGMVVDYSADEGLEAGVRKTFSGEAPCPLCKRIAIERNDPVTEQMTLSVRGAVPDAHPAVHGSLPVPPATSREDWPATVLRPSLMLDPPEAPPPRMV